MVVSQIFIQTIDLHCKSKTECYHNHHVAYTCSCFLWHWLVSVWTTVWMTCMPWQSNPTKSIRIRNVLFNCLHTHLLFVFGEWRQSLQHRLHLFLKLFCWKSLLLHANIMWWSCDNNSSHMTHTPGTNRDRVSRSWQSGFSISEHLRTCSAARLNGDGKMESSTGNVLRDESNWVSDP